MTSTEQLTEITRSEWKKIHRDYKVTAGQALDGQPKVMRSENGGTCLVPVVIVADLK